MQILRDPVRLAFAFVGSALLMLVFGFGITTDVEHIRYAALDLDQSPESRAYLEQFAASPRYFTPTPPVRSADEALERLQSDDVSVVLEIPPSFGRDFRRGRGPGGPGAGGRRDDVPRRHRRAVRAGRARHGCCRIPRAGCRRPRRASTRPTIEERYMYNPTFESIYSIVPSVPALLLLLIPAILMTVSIVREKELGSIINFYVTPTGQARVPARQAAPYVAIGMINFFILTALALVVFGVPIKGSFLMLTLCTLLYVTATTGIGMVTSTFTSSQVAAVFVTAILTIVPTIQFSGLLQPVSTLEGSAAFVGSIWPATYYMHSSLGAYTKGLGAAPHAAGHRCSWPAASRSCWRISVARPEEAGEVAMTIAAEHLLARAQGASQPDERRGAWSCSSSTRSRWRSTSRRRAPRARSTTPRSPSSTRTSRRCPRSCSTRSIRRASSCPS